VTPKEEFLEAQMSQGPGLEFEESMSRWIGIGEKSYVAGRIAGQQENTPIRFDAKIIIDDLDRFIHLPDHRARLEGTYRYRGPIYELTEGFGTRFSHMKQKKAYLRECRADFTINFRAQPYAITPFPFVIANNVLAQMASGLKWVIRNILPAEHLLGIFITPHTVTVDTGTLKISTGGQTTGCNLVPERTFGKAERSTFKNIKEPTRLYGYICAVRPGVQTARVQTW
jgi:hypothetical protein